MNLLSKKAAFYSLILMLFCRTAWSQTGPGGVGSTDGSSSLELWLRADDPDADGNFNNNPANGTLISTWADYSGNNNQYSNTGGNRPSYKTTGTFDAIEFDATSTPTQFLSSSNSGIYTPGSVFFALNPLQSGNSNALFDSPTLSLRVSQWPNTNRAGYTRYGVADYQSNLTTPFGINSIYSFHKPTSSNELEIRVNDDSDFVNIGSTTAGIPFGQIGRNSTGSDKAYGDFFEVILFSEDINLAQKIIIENYLSAKFGSIAIADDVFDEDDPSNGNYDHEVAGIGRWNQDNQHTEAQGTDILRILNPTNLENDEYLLWGHDNGTTEFNTTTNLPISVVSRLEKIWRASEVSRSGSTVNVGNIDMRFDLTGISVTNNTELVLLVDSDNDGSFSDETPITGATDLGSNIFEFDDVSAIENNLRFTLGLQPTCPTPVCIPLSIQIVNN